LPCAKRRRDVTLEDEALIRETQARIRRRVVLEIAKVHPFHVTRMERCIISCYAAEDGAAIVFSCSLLYAVSRVTRGHCYAFLPFLYDEAAAGIREANNVHLGEGLGLYRS
jgi:hypothetical protein